MKNSIIFSIFMFSNIFILAQVDSSSTSTYTDFEEFENLTDSLLQLWYKQNAPYNEELDSSLFSNDTAFIPFFSDEVILTQINRMNSYIEMTYNSITRQYIDFYAYKRRNLVSYMLGNSEYYFPYFEEALDRYGLPLELKYLPVIESALNPRAYSRARAVGLWQFILPTARLYNLKVTSFIDERMDIIKASDAAARYLRDLYNVFQDWHLTIAAYNCGPGNINKAIKRSGKTTYWEMYNYLPRETRGYVPAFIAAAYTFHYYKELNIIPKKTYIPTNVDTVYVNKMLHLKQVSELLKIPIELLEVLNPQYKKDIIPGNSDNPLPLYLPVENVSEFITLGDSVYKYKDTLFFKSIRPSSYIAASNSNMEEVAIYHKVKKGETVGTIARKYHVKISDLKAWNNLKGKNPIIRKGQNLVIYVMRKKRTRSQQKNSNPTDSLNLKVVVPNDTIKNENITNRPSYHIVKKGDSLYSIAKLYNITIEDICKANNISKSEIIKVGQRINLPK